MCRYIGNLVANIKLLYKNEVFLKSAWERYTSVSQEWLSLWRKRANEGEHLGLSVVLLVSGEGGREGGGGERGSQHGKC